MQELDEIDPADMKKLSGVNELEFVDADIRAAFAGKMWSMGTPTMIQLSRDLRNLTEQIRDAKQKFPGFAACP